MNLKITEGQKVSRQDIAFCLASSPNSNELFFGSSDSKVYHIDLGAEKAEGVAFEGEGHSSYVTGLARPNPQLLVTSSYDKHLAWWDVETRKLIRRAPAHEKWLRDVVASPDGKTVASVADDMVCRLWDAELGELRAELRGHEAITPNDYPSMLFACAWNADGSRLATADKVGHIVIWDPASGQQLQTLEATTMYTWDPKQRRHSIGGVRSLRFSPDGTQLVAGGMGQVGNIDHLGGKARFRAFDLATGETLAEIESNKVKGLVERLEFHPNGDWLIGLGGDHKGFAIGIDPATWKIVAEEQTPYHVHDFALNESADTICAAGHNAIGTFVIEGKSA